MDILEGSIDLTRAVFLIGAVLALLYKKKLGVTPGGVIVPGTLAGILFSSFTAFLVVLASSVICMLLYKLVFAHYALSKRWSAFIIIAMSVVLGLGLMAAAQQMYLNQEVLLLSLVTPGLITISARKYGFGKVTFGALTVTTACCLIAWFLSMLIPYEAQTYLSVQLAAFAPLTLTNPYLVLPISLAVSALVYYRFGVRGGGYLIAPFIAVVAMNSPLQLLLVLLSVALSYLAILAIQKYTLLFGLERFVACLFLGYFFVTIMDVLAITVGLGEGYSPAPLVLIIAIAVMTNDLALQSIKHTLSKGVAPSLIASYLARLAV